LTSNHWLAVSPDPTVGHSLSNIEFCTLMRWKLGLPLLPNPPHTCPKCGEPQDPLGDHAVRCRKNGLWQRHNDLCTTFSSILDLAGYSYRLEAHAPSRRRPADILISGWRGGSSLAVDFTIRHVDGAWHSEAVSQALKEAERSKRIENRPSCDAMGWLFEPFAASPFGIFSPAAHTIISRLINEVLVHQAQEDGSPDPAADIFRTLWGDISFALHRAVARQLVASLPSAAPSPAAT